MVVVLAIVGVMAILSYPRVKRWYCRYRLDTFSRDLFSYMQLSRLFAMSYGHNTYILFIPDKRFVVFYVDDIDSSSGAGKIDRDINDIDGDGDTTENESDHITFPLPDTLSASEVPPSRKGSLGNSGEVRGVKLPLGYCSIQFKRPSGVPKVPSCSSEQDITFSADQAEFMPDGRGKTGAVYISNCYGDTFAITVSFLGRVKLWEYSGGSWK